MADLRIVDAPEIPTENITGEEKLPTGGNGNYSISLDSLADYTKTKKDLADNTSVDGKVGGVRQELDAHIEDLTNPHQVTKGQIGLGNVDNTADADKPVSNSTQAAIISAVAPKADKSYVDNQLTLKANKSDVDSQLSLKANKADVYTKAETYTKQESNDLVNSSISTALNPVNSSLDLAKRGIANRYDSSLTYNSGERVVLTNGDIAKSTISNNTNDPNTDMTGWVKVNSADQIFDESGLSQQQWNNGVESIDALRLISPKIKGNSVVLTSANLDQYEGGGRFVATQKAGLVDNGGTIIASSNPLFFWVRVDYDYLTPEMFGADGINDDYLAIKTMYATLPRTGGEVRLSRFYKVSKGVLIPPRSKTVGVGRDACGFLKTTHDFESVSDRIWQNMTRSYNIDYLVAIDIDSDIWGNIDGDQIRSTTLKDFSAKCIAPVGVASFGLYTFEVYHFNVESVTFENVDVGVEYEGWLARMLSVSVRNCRVGLRVPSGGTSLHCDNFYVKNVSERAYDLNNLTYSTFTTCCVDFCEDIAYRIHGCFGIVFNGCGFEEVKNHDLYITDSNIAINSMRGMNNSWGTNTVSSKYIGNSKVIFNGCHYNYYGVTGSNGRKPWEITNNSIISLVNTTHPAKENMPSGPDKYDFGSGRNIVNITNEDGVSTIVGGSGSQYKGVMNNGIFTVISDYDAPSFAVPLLLDGTRWNRKVPNSVGYYGWVFNAATGQWLPISKVVV